MESTDSLTDRYVGLVRAATRFPELIRTESLAGEPHAAPDRFHRHSAH
jgi:hypothetical protein